MRNDKTRPWNSFSGGFVSEKGALGMNAMEKFISALGALCAMAAMPGCATTETTTTTHASSVATASTESVAVSVSTETTTATRSTTPPPPPTPAVDVLSDVKKPCGTVAADTPNFVGHETTK